MHNSCKLVNWILENQALFSAEYHLMVLDQRLDHLRTSGNVAVSVNHGQHVPVFRIQCAIADVAYCAGRQRLGFRP